MRVIDIENINYGMRNETRYVLKCEEIFHDKIQTAVSTILTSIDTHPYVMLSGPSGSGKTTTALRIRDYLENLGVPVCLLSMDNFFYSSDARPPETEGDMESPYCVNRELLFSCMEQLKSGKEVDLPKFNFVTGKSDSTFKLQIDPASVIIVEGIHTLNPLLFDRHRESSVGVYVAPRTRILTADEKIVKPEQLRVARRLIRDFHTRGHSLRKTVELAQSVDRGEVKYIMPYKSNAIIHIDSFLDYEPCLLAKYLREIPQFSEELDPEFIKSHGLTDLMNVVQNIQPLKTLYVPKNSLIREFVGGSCYTY